MREGAATKPPRSLVAYKFRNKFVCLQEAVLALLQPLPELQPRRRRVLPSVLRRLMAQPFLRLLIVAAAAEVHANTRAQTCCSEDAISCAITCTGCLPCFGCIGPQMILPWCWGCSLCTGCLVSCTPYLDCYVTTPDCSTTMVHAGRARSWIVGSATDSCGGGPCPLLLAMHGWTMTDDMIRSDSAFDSKVSSHGGAVVVYPDGWSARLLDALPHLAAPRASILSPPCISPCTSLSPPSPPPPPISQGRRAVLVLVGRRRRVARRVHL